MPQAYTRARPASGSGAPPTWATRGRPAEHLSHTPPPEVMISFRAQVRAYARGAQGLRLIVTWVRDQRL